MATIDWFTGSKVGVIAAPSTNAMTIAYLLCLARNSGVTIPILDRKKRITGVWNTIPIQNNSDNIKLM